MDIWLKFINSFKIATITTDFGHKVHIKEAAVVNAIREDKMKIFEGFGIDVDDIRYAAPVTGFEEYFRGRENKTILRHRLFNSNTVARRGAIRCY